MNFSLPTIDGYLLQHEQALGQPSEQGVASAGHHHGEAADAAAGGEGPSAAQAAPPLNSLKKLLHQIASVAAAAQRMPVGDDYTIKTSSSSSARRATEAAAADTLRILLDLASGYSEGSRLSHLKRAEALHRSLAAPPSPSSNGANGSSSSSIALLHEDGQQIHEGVGVSVQGLLDELLEAVDSSLEAHRRNPQKKVRTRLSQGHQQDHQQEQQKEQKTQQKQQHHVAVSDSPASSHSSRRGLPLPDLLAVLEGRPQSHWAYLINNNSKRFVPRLQQKPHKKYPLSPATVEAQQQQALWLERRRELFEDAELTAGALEAATGQQRQQLLQQLQQQGQQIEKLQQEENESQKLQSSEPLPHPYEGELKDLEWLLQGDKQQPDIYSELMRCMFTGAATCVCLQTDFFALKEPTIPQPVEKTPFVLVETPEQLREMLDELCSGRHKVVAIDTEHHSYESYKGFVCLLQLSTCSSVGAAKDFFIDPFSLFAYLPALNELTANPKILKVLHGSASDVIWLQRDFSVYLVNVFDTAVAARTLAVPGGASLANLLSFYLKKQKDKKMQLADWRIRPLTEAMKTYGRSDTHYLPYIYQCMQNQILARDDQTGMYNLGSTTPEELGAPTASGRSAMLSVLERSRDICLSTYTEGPFDEEKEATQLLKRNNTALAPLSFAVLKGLLSWRDSVARKRDVSPHAVLANACILLLAQRRPLNHVQLRHAIRPTPPALNRYGAEILRAIQGALEKAVSSPAPAAEPDQRQQPGEQEKQEEKQQQQQQSEPMLDDTDDLLPSAAVLREAVAAQQQQLLAAADASIPPSQGIKEETDTQSRPSGYESTSISNSCSSNSSCSDDSKWPEQHDVPVQFGGYSSCSDDSKWPEQHDVPVQFGGFFSIGVKGPKPPVIVRVSSTVLSSRTECPIFNSTALSSSSSSFGNARNVAQKARQVARWVYRQLQRMEKGILLHVRSTRQQNRVATPMGEQQQKEQTHDSKSLDSLILPAHPPPPPDPETVGAAVAEPTRIRGSAATVSAEAATASQVSPDASALPDESRDIIGGSRDGKRGHPAETDISLGLIPVAQQTWKRRKKQRGRAAGAATAAATARAETDNRTRGLHVTSTTPGAAP
ncbi:exosome component 10, putative [Eimeria praecox]|uniref:Exosome component 10, putative n=1 Tax=Eimeria praecox TaxID=51316 RepID=U6G4D9_9EIME|nr:exosome component 10, putative [Eimeria praecox]